MLKEQVMKKMIKVLKKLFIKAFKLAEEPFGKNTYRYTKEALNLAHFFPGCSWNQSSTNQFSTKVSKNSLFITFDWF